MYAHKNKYDCMFLSISFFFFVSLDLSYFQSFFKPNFLLFFPFPKRNKDIKTYKTGSEYVYV